MLTMRTFVGFVLCIVLICIGLFVYREYATRNFEEILPPPIVVRVAEETPVEPSTFYGPVDFGGTPSLQDAPVVSDAVSTETAISDAVFEPAEMDEMSREEADLIIGEAFKFKFTDLDVMYASLEAAMASRFGDDPRVPRLLDLWEASYYIIQKVNELNEKGGDMTPLLEMLPSYVFREASEISISLFNHDATSAERIRRKVDHLENQMGQLEMAAITGPMVEEAYRNGEITVDEAKAFFSAATGLELIVSE